MGQPRPRLGKRLRTVLHQIRLRPRLTAAALVGLAAYLAMAVAPVAFLSDTRALVAWDAGTGLYVALAWTMMLRPDVERMRARAREQDDGAAVVLALTVGAAVASLAAIVRHLVGLAPAHRSSHFALAVVTIFFSWCFIHTAFALHYAHEYYLDRGKRGPGLDFPGGDPPDYADFLYFSFVIGATSQTSDVSIQSPSLRRLVLLHGVIAFFFNTTLLALSVSLAGTLV